MPFEHFQRLKPQILKDEIFMDSLRTYAFTDRLKLFGNNKVVPLGAGRNNIHFRIGKIGNIWLASREYLAGLDREDDLQHCENYIDCVVRTYQQGKRVPIVCGGVKVEVGEDIRYFLLLEDLTQGGTADFQPAPKYGGRSGKLNGVEVFHDFDTEEPFHPPNRYMAEDKLIILRR